MPQHAHQRVHQLEHHLQHVPQTDRWVQVASQVGLLHLHGRQIIILNNQDLVQTEPPGIAEVVVVLGVEVALVEGVVREVEAEVEDDNKLYSI